jgi:hypothetical protein
MNAEVKIVTEVIEGIEVEKIVNEEEFDQYLQK